MENWLDQTVQKAAERVEVQEQEVLQVRQVLTSEMAENREQLIHVKSDIRSSFRRVEEMIHQSGMKLKVDISPATPQIGPGKLEEERLTLGRKSLAIGFDESKKRLHAEVMDTWSNLKTEKDLSLEEFDLENILEAFLEKALG